LLFPLISTASILNVLLFFTFFTKILPPKNAQAIMVIERNSDNI